jgi:hypothetical protein
MLGLFARGVYTCNDTYIRIGLQVLKGASVSEENGYKQGQLVEFGWEGCHKLNQQEGWSQI